MYVNMLVGVGTGDVHIVNIPDQCCADGRSLFATLCALCVLKAHRRPLRYKRWRTVTPMSVTPVSVRR